MVRIKIKLLTFVDTQWQIEELYLKSDNMWYTEKNEEFQDLYKTSGKLRLKETLGGL